MPTRGSKREGTAAACCWRPKSSSSEAANATASTRRCTSGVGMMLARKGSCTSPPGRFTVARPPLGREAPPKAAAEEVVVDACIEDAPPSVDRADRRAAEMSARPIAPAGPPPPWGVDWPHGNASNIGPTAWLAVAARASRIERRNMAARQGPWRRIEREALPTSSNPIVGQARGPRLSIKIDVGGAAAVAAASAAANACAAAVAAAIPPIAAAIEDDR